MQPGSHDGQLRSTLETVLVPAPPEGVWRKVVWCEVFNVDTASVTLTVQVRNTFTATTRTVFKGALAVDDLFVVGSTGEYLWLSNVQSLVAVLAAAPTANQPDHYASWEDYP